MMDYEEHELLALEEAVTLAKAIYIDARNKRYGSSHVEWARYAELLHTLRMHKRSMKNANAG
jgi:hypothetical protein